MAKAMRVRLATDWIIWSVALNLCCALLAIGQARADDTALSQACPLQPSASGSEPTPPAVMRVARITGPNSFLTTDGREIRLAGVTTPHRFALAPSSIDPVAADSSRQDEADLDTDPIAASRSALQTWLLGQIVQVSTITPSPDRYGRLRARVVRASDSLWIEAELVKQGLARVEPQRDDFGCARVLEAIEAFARGKQLGLWALPEFAVVKATDPSRDRWTGHFVLIEGDIVSLGTSGARHYINFGRNFSRDFAVLLVDKDGSAGRGKTPLPSRFRAAGFEAPDMAGKRIRVRGILLRGGGGLIMPAVPEEIEWVANQD